MGQPNLTTSPSLSLPSPFLPLKVISVIPLAWLRNRKFDLVFILTWYISFFLIITICLHTNTSLFNYLLQSALSSTVNTSSFLQTIGDICFFKFAFDYKIIPEWMLLTGMPPSCPASGVASDSLFWLFCFLEAENNFPTEDISILDVFCEGPN